MDNIPSESTVSAQRSQKRVLWIRGALTALLVAATLTVLLAREAPTFLLTARDRVFPLAAPIPTATAVPTPSVADVLRSRPLRIPALAAGEACVATPAKEVTPDLGPALGDGPVYMVGYGTEGITSYYGGREDGGWYYLKTIWAAPPNFHSVFLLRGRQVDGSNEARFSQDDTATPDPQAVYSSEPVPGSMPSGWLPWVRYVRVRAPGCYGIQVDGQTFSEVIRFKVVDTPYVPQG
jgi:hypothetical protein